MSAMKRLIEDVLEMYNDRYSIPEISDATGLTTQEIRTIIRDYYEETTL